MDTQWSDQGMAAAAAPALDVEVAGWGPREPQGGGRSRGPPSSAAAGRRDAQDETWKHATSYWDTAVGSGDSALPVL